MGGGNHQGGCNPGATGDADFRERGGQQKPGADGQEITAANQEFIEKTFQRGEGRIILRERRAGLGAFGGPFQNGSAGIDDDGFARAAPDGEIGGRIAGVVKTAFAEFFGERLEFIGAAKVGFTVAPSTSSNNPT